MRLNGNEKRFIDFISRLNEKDKIALISHNDIDGIAAAKVANEVLHADILRFVAYRDLDDKLIEELKKSRANKVVFTDLNFTSADFIRNIEKFAEILIIDHHKFSEDYNSKRTVFLNSQGYCAGYLCYLLFSKAQDIGHLDWLVACSCISDYMYFNNQEWMRWIFSRYGDEFVVENEQIRKSGTFWDLQSDLSLALVYFKDNVKKVYDSIGDKFGSIGDLKEYAVLVQNETEASSEKFMNERVEIPGGYFWEVKSKFSVREILINILSFREPHKTFIFSHCIDDFCMISSRRQDKAIDLPVFLNKLIEGFERSGAGGHVPAAGAQFPKSYLSEFKRRLGVKA